MKLDCNKHEISRTKESQNIQECCTNCLEVLFFKQIPGYRIIHHYTFSDYPEYISIYNNVIESEKNCKLCGKPLYEFMSTDFKLCSDCYRISSGGIESILTKELIPIFYLPWWDDCYGCRVCNLNLKLTSDCQKYCSNCYIFYIGCRYCLTTNVIFGLIDQSQCKKCRRVTLIDSTNLSSGNSDLDKLIHNLRFDIKNLKIDEFADKIKNLGNYFKPDEIISFIYQNLRKLEIIMEWIPYYQFTNVKKIAEGGFSNIYRAIWLDGPQNLIAGDHNESRNKNETVILKRFKNSQDISKDFLNELKSIQSCYKINHHIIQPYAVTKDPDLESYMLVMQYASRGDLHSYLQNDFTNITWNKQKLYILWQISEGYLYFEFIIFIIVNL
ncbi:hypothetical protein C1645_298228 [Glomus cerebriforme]|uniref:Protein kinase domain-containing protein n=1 Tax=Glomus cerebriforme TaxID=658196 RepID=A0A397SWG3_9GLOM|nr:hypothetical protein C1645_298228 [Glomus cerebriforme]